MQFHGTLTPNDCEHEFVHCLCAGFCKDRMEVKRGPRALCLLTLASHVFTTGFCVGSRFVDTHRSPIRLLCPSRVPLHELCLRFDDHFELRRLFLGTLVTSEEGTPKGNV